MLSMEALHTYFLVVFPGKATLSIMFIRETARTQSLTNKNNAFELSTLGIIARVNPTLVQW